MFELELNQNQKGNLKREQQKTALFEMKGDWSSRITTWYWTLT